MINYKEWPKANDDSKLDLQRQASKRVDSRSQNVETAVNFFVEFF